MILLNDTNRRFRFLIRDRNAKITAAFEAVFSCGCTKVGLQR